MKFGRIFCIYIAGNGQMKILPADDFIPNQLSYQPDAAISLPTALFELISVQMNSSLGYAHYNQSNLFPINGGKYINDSAPRQTIVGTDIVAAAVVKENFINLDDDMNITVVFLPQIPGGKVYSYYKIVRLHYFP